MKITIYALLFMILSAKSFSFITKRYVRFSKSSNYVTLLSSNPGMQEFHKYFPHISDNQWSKLSDYADKLKEWNALINVISRKDIDHVFINHILPCLAMTSVANRLIVDGNNVIDVGTGGGLPGIVMAIVFPNVRFTLVDSNSKKIKVVDDIVKTLVLNNTEVRWTRSENIIDKYDFIIGRAVTALPNFLSYTSHLIKSDVTNNNGGILYIKGGDFVTELNDAKIKKYNLFPITEIINNIESDKYILQIPKQEVIDYHNNRRNNL